MKFCRCDKKNVLDQKLASEKLSAKALMNSKPYVYMKKKNSGQWIRRTFITHTYKYRSIILDLYDHTCFVQKKKKNKANKTVAHYFEKRYINTTLFYYIAEKKKTRSPHESPSRKICPRYRRLLFFWFLYTYTHTHTNTAPFMHHT